MGAQALTLTPATFDLVVSSFVVPVLDDPAAGIAEAFRVPAPGGPFALTADDRVAPDSGVGRGPVS